MTYTTYTVASAAVLTYAFSFDTLDDSHVEVLKNGLALTNPTEFTVNTSDKTITLVMAPTVGDTLYIRRSTPRTELVVEFTDGSRDKAENLNKALKQPLFVIEETDETGTLAVNGDGNFDAGGRKIVNLGTPTAQFDAATKKYIDDLVLAALDYGNAAGVPNVYQFTANGTSTIQVVDPAPADVVLDSGSWLLIHQRPDAYVGNFVMVPPTYFSMFTSAGKLYMELTNTSEFYPGGGEYLWAIELGKSREYIGNALSSNKWLYPIDLTLTGDILGTAPVEGNNDVSLATTLKTIATITPNTLFTNANIKLDANGRVIEAANGSGATDLTGASSGSAGVHGLAPAPAAGDQNKFLRGDGVWAYSPSINGRQVFIANGTYTVPAGITKVMVTLVGGGGHGSSRANNPNGCAGARARGVVSVTPGASISVAVGAAGNGGANGGASSFGAFLVCAGGFNSSPSVPTVTGSASGTADIYTPIPDALVVHSTTQLVDSLRFQFGDPGRITSGPTYANGYPGIVIVEW